jgi:hypothetical protein
MSSEIHNDLKDLDDLDFEENDEDEDEFEIKNNFKQLGNKKSNSDYLKDIDDLSGEDSNDDDGDDDDGMNEDEDNNSNNELLDTKDIVKLVKAKLSSSVGSFRKSAKYQNQFSIIKKAVQQQHQNENDSSLDDHQHVMKTEVHLKSGMTMMSGDVGTLDTDREYQLILDCNKLIHDIDDEILETHR